MLLKPLDVVVAVRAAVDDAPTWTIAQMADHLEMDTAQVFRAARDAAKAQLLVAEASASKAKFRPHRAALIELLLHGIKYMVVPARGSLTRGIPTAHGSPFFKGKIQSPEAPPVWPTSDGKVRGESFEPLHRCVPAASMKNERFYEAMALVDAIRGGRARERAIAADMLPGVIGAKR